MQSPLAAIVHEELVAAEVRILARVAALFGAPGDAPIARRDTKPDRDPKPKKPAPLDLPRDRKLTNAEAATLARAVLDAFADGEQLSAGDVAARLGPTVTRHRASTALGKLVAARKLKRTGERAGARYQRR